MGIIFRPYGNINFKLVVIAMAEALPLSLLAKYFLFDVVRTK